MYSKEDVFKFYKAHIDRYRQENKNGASLVKESLDRSPLFFRGSSDKTCQIPKIYDEKTILELREIVENSHRIFSKVVNEYRINKDYRKIFAFPEEVVTYNAT